ncbi:MAG: YbhB/YbcL family Raf kinase inhibitor-like protein [Kofleriaceae bacterium]|nr:YbhB/YbcL family Raf kinase inhibitor-like protein [Kofleriaceae bacterium]
MRPLTTFLTTACMTASVHAGAPSSLSVTSSAFSANGEIPSEHTCDGAQLSPPLAWSTPPAGTKSIAVLVDDPDAPRGAFTHWIVTGLPATTTSLAAGAKLPSGAITGKNDFGATGWGGPCPPRGRHRYVFHVYALDIPLAKALTPAQFKSAIADHVLAAGELVGTYQRT